MPHHARVERTRTSGLIHEAEGPVRVMRLVRRGENPVIVCELGPWMDWPSYQERRAIRRRALRDTREVGRWSSLPDSPVPLREDGDVVPDAGDVLFTDSSHLRWLWTGTLGTQDGLIRYVERDPGRGEDVASMVEAMRAGRAAVGLRGRGPRIEGLPKAAPKVEDSAAGSTLTLPAGAAAAEGMILQQLPRPVRESIGPGRRLAVWCRDSEQAPSVLGVISEGLSRVRIVDFDCGRGDRLLPLAAWLESLWLACLDRAISGYLEPVEGQPSQASLGELEPLAHGSRGRLSEEAGTLAEVRRRIAAGQVFGWTDDPVMRRRCRRRLAAWAGLTTGGDGFELNVRRLACEALAAGSRSEGRGQPPRWSPPRRHPLDVPIPSAQPRKGARQERSVTEDLLEEDRILRLSREAAISARSILAATRSAPDSFAAEWERRRRDLIRKIVRSDDGRALSSSDWVQAERAGLWSTTDLVYEVGPSAGTLGPRTHGNTPRSTNTASEDDFVS